MSLGPRLLERQTWLCLVRMANIQSQCSERPLPARCFIISALRYSKTTIISSTEPIAYIIGINRITPPLQSGARSPAF